MQLKYDSNGNLISKATGGQTLYIAMIPIIVW